MKLNEHATWRKALTVFHHIPFHYKHRDSQTVSLLSMIPSLWSTTLFTTVFTKTFFPCRKRWIWACSTVEKIQKSQVQYKSFTTIHLNNLWLCFSFEFIPQRYYDLICGELPPKAFQFCLLAERVLQGWLTANAHFSVKAIYHQPEAVADRS